jgi:hypothetical protein
VLGVALGRRDKAQELVLLDPVGGFDRDHLRLAARECPGVVERHGVDIGRALERDRALEQGPAPRALAAADHDRRWRRQPERVGARDHDHGDREQQRLTDIAADDPRPNQERDGAGRQGDQHEPERGAIGEPLRRCL